MKTRLKYFISDKDTLPLWLHTTFLVVCSFVVLIGFNTDLLYIVQDQSLFMSGGIFLHECLQQVGGGLEWVARYLTQWMYYPWLGASALVAVWLACYLLVRRVFSLPDRWTWLCLVPSVALLYSTIDLGYWIYYFKQPAYWFRESVGVLIVLLLLQPRVGRANAVMSFVAILLYPWIGWYAVLAAGLLMLRQLLERDWINGGVSAVLLLIAPSAIARCYETMPTGEAWSVGFPLVETFGLISWTKTLPFLVMILTLIGLVVYDVLGKKSGENPQPKTLSWRLLGLHLLALSIMSLVVWHSNYGDYNYHAELRIYRSCQESRWDKIIEDIDHAPEGPTRQMVMAKNLALLHTGHLGDLMFAFPNSGPGPMVDDSLKVYSAQTFSAMYYLYHGLANDAIHWSFETGVENGFSVGNLKVLSLASILQGESQAARKYLEMLGRTSFHRDFAARYYPLVNNPELIDNYPELQLMHELHDDIATTFFKDEGLPEWRVYKIFANQLDYDSRLGKELALSYSMMLKQFDLFWFHLYGYCRLLKRSEKLPVYYQEAAYLGCQLDPTNHPVDDFRFDGSVAPRYNLFRNKAQHPLFEPTYWWFYYFCSDVQTY